MRSHIPLTFPSTRKALWSHASLGEPVLLSCPRLSLSVTEQALYLAYGLSRTTKSIQCWLTGTVNVEADCSEIVISIEHLEGNEAEDSLSSFRISTKLIRSSRHQPSPLNSATIENGALLLAERARQPNKVQVSEFLHATAECTLFSGANQICCDFEVDIMLPNLEFEARPIKPVSVAVTALSKSVLSPDKHGIISTQYKSGYLTMDQYRKVIFLLESDPKVLTLPIIGIWVSGVELIHHPYIWACCIRYMHTTQVRDRVPKPLEPFLLIHKSPLMSSAQYFDCTPDSCSLNYKLVSGGRRFSMDKDVPGKRTGRLLVKTDHQELSSPRGLDFAKLLQKPLQHEDKENVLPMAKATENKMADDSLPWSSPIPDKSHRDVVTLTVPEVSLLDESSPLEAPNPERCAPKNVLGARFGHSHADKVDKNHTMPKLLSTDLPTVFPPASYAVLPPALTSPSPIITPEENIVKRQITFDQSDNATVNAPMPDNSKSAEFLQRPELVSQQSQEAREGVDRPLHVTTQSPTVTCISENHHVPQTLLAEPWHTRHHYCQCQYSNALQSAPSGRVDGMLDSRYSTPSAALTRDPLTVITANVKRLLSPRPAVDSSARPPTGYHTPVSSSGYKGMEVSPISVVGQASCGSESCPQTPAPAQRHPAPISPEVEEILRQQDAQLKALQQQIQKLLNAQKDEKPVASQKSAVKRTASAAVNTGVSLFESKQGEYFGSTTDSRDSARDSSQSHSLIQHDLTTLDFPTQLTARSFTSDMNVDYESYDDSLTGSPKRNESYHSRSEDSWQSPVLGESVSMIAKSTNPGSTKHHLDVIIKNVRDLLAKRATQEDDQENVTTDELDGCRASPGQIFMKEETGYLDPEAREICPEESIGLAERDKDPAARNQLRKIGMDIEPCGQIASGEPAPLPRLQYLSMVMTDSTLDSNKSLELNALALKYLHNDQLTELAQLTVHRGDNPSITNESSLLRKLLMMPTRSPPKNVIESNDMSMAAQQYLKKYELDTTMSDLSATHPPTDQPPVSHLKSILRNCHEVTDKSKGQEMSLHVLDIDRLKELPKLL